MNNSLPLACTSSSKDMKCYIIKQKPIHAILVYGNLTYLYLPLKIIIIVDDSTNYFFDNWTKTLLIKFTSTPDYVDCN